MGDEISKKSEKEHTGLHQGLKLRLAPNEFALSFTFLNAFNRSLLLLCVLEPRAFNPESQHFIPLFNKECATLWPSPFTLRSIFKAKEELWKFKYSFHRAKI
jgi:hypothetical protein